MRGSLAGRAILSVLVGMVAIGSAPVSAAAAPASCVTAEAPAELDGPSSTAGALPRATPEAIAVPLTGRSTYRTTPWPGTWDRVGRSPLAVRLGAVASVASLGGRGALVAWGGTRFDGSPRMDGTVYRLGTARWSAIADAPLCTRTKAGVLLWAGRLIVWGGVTPTGEPLVDGAVYGLRSGRWTPLPPAPITGGPFVLSGWGRPLLLGTGIDGRLTLAHLALGSAQPRWEDVEAVPLPLGIGYEVTGVGSGADVMAISHQPDGTAMAARRRSSIPAAWMALGAPPIPVGSGGGPVRGPAGVAWVRTAVGPDGVRSEQVILHDPADPTTGWRRWSGAPGLVSADDRLLWSPSRLISPDVMVAWDPRWQRWEPIRQSRRVRLDAQAVWWRGHLYVWGGRRLDGRAALGLLRFTPALPPTEVALPLNDHVGGCDLTAIDVSRMRLRGASDDPRVAWFQGDGRSIPTRWPDGYTARFDPDLEILDPLGRVIAREGDVPRRWMHSRFAGQRVCFWSDGAWFLGPAI